MQREGPDVLQLGAKKREITLNKGEHSLVNVSLGFS